MMLFEEFFKKKKINLVALNEADPELFSEFKDHYEQMGEKSFDHTKKYWFNKLRRQYPAPVEVKAEKFKAENQIAEQTVSDTLTEPTPRDKAPDLSKAEAAVNEQATPAASAPKLGFKPKFKSAVVPPPLDNLSEPSTENIPDATPAAPVAKKPGFTPRFKAGVTAAAKPEELPAEEPGTAESSGSEAEKDTNEQAPVVPPKIGFKPRFKAGVTAAAKPEVENAESTVPEDTDKPIAEAPKTAAPKMGFTPRFKAGVTQTKPEENATPVVNAEPQKGTDEAIAKAESPAEQPAPAKLGFKPRFKAGVTSAKPSEEQAMPPIVDDQEKSSAPVEQSAESVPAEPEVPAPKPAYKPRFTPNMIKRKPPEEE